MAKALFLDRDGVINVDYGYVHRIKDFKFIDGIFDLCRAAKKLDYLLIVVTNQAGIGRGLYTESDFFALTEWMKYCFENEGCPLTDVYFCPFHPEFGVGQYKKDSFDRKPNPGMLVKAIQKYRIDTDKSILIGDNESDLKAGLSANISKNILFHEKINSENHHNVCNQLVDVIKKLK
jgi:D-glycero-D-manno-heptose 1,7-bisphosphate phosphatase